MNKELTPEEIKAIKSIKRLAKKWPNSLQLFACGTGSNGFMVILKDNKIAAEIKGIPCDGGDPDPFEYLDQDENE